ncbi:unnamed protein product, partial [Didymodactylos carnosus]
MDQRSSRSRIDRSKETVRQNCLQDLPRKKRQPVHAIMPHTSGSTSYGLIASTDDEDPEFVKELEEYQERQEEVAHKILQTIKTLDHTRPDLFNPWIQSVERAFSKMKYLEHVWTSHAAQFLDMELQKWYKDNISLFVNNWEVFKHQLQNHFFPSI